MVGNFDVLPGLTSLYEASACAQRGVAQVGEAHWLR